MSFFLRALLVFCIGTALSSLWAIYLKYFNAQRAVAAAFADVLLVAASIAWTLAYVHDIRMIPIQLAAAWLGTYLTIKRSGRLGAK